MQPGPPHTSRPPLVAPIRGSSIGPGLIVGMIALMAFLYLADHAGKGDTAVFGGVDRRILAQDFRHGQCMAVFGGCKIDLRDAQMQGREAVLEIYAIFGGAEIRVPENWEVMSRGVRIFGGFDDRTRRFPSRSDTKTLILDGAAVFGAVTIKD